MGEQLGDLADALFDIEIWSFQSLQAQGGKIIHIREGFASTQGQKDKFVEGQCEMVSLGF